MRSFTCSGVSFLGFGGPALTVDLSAFVEPFFARDEAAFFVRDEAVAERFLRVEV